MTRTKNKSPFSVSYNDLIASVERILTTMKATYPRKISEGSISSWTAQHNIAVEEAKLRLLKKFKRDPQADLFKEFEKMK